MKNLAVVFALALTGCLQGQHSQLTPVASPSPTPADSPAPPAVTPMSLHPTMLAWDGKHKDAAVWSKHLISQVENSKLPTLIPTDITSICPAYPKASVEGRVQFWAQLVSIMAKFESGFRPEWTYVEKDIRDAKGKNVVSSGLLQISVESGRNYGCSLPTAESLFGPKTNLTCGIQILSNRVARDGRLKGQVGASWKGGSAYWSVLRSTTTKCSGVKPFRVCKTVPREAHDAIVKYVSGLAVCRGEK